MQRRICFCMVLLLGFLTEATNVHAAGPDTPRPIVGQDVMGDKSRSGPDGWSWAPVTRDRAPSGKAPGQTQASVSSAPNAQPEKPGPYILPPGQDPGTPASPSSSGPGTLDATPKVLK